MKNRNEKTKNLIKGLVFGAVVVALLAVTIGCGKKDNKNAAAYNPYAGAYGYGTPGYGNGVINNVSAGFGDNGQFKFMLVLATSGDPGQMGYGAGPVYVQGELRVYSGMGCTANPQIGLAPGNYQILPFNGQLAMLDVDFLTNAVVEARGPSGSAIVTIPYARTFQTNVCGMDGMMGFVTVETVNGYPCVLSSGFSDRVAGGVCY